MKPRGDARELAGRPWQANPYHLVSWWDMQNFSAKNFGDAITIIERVQYEWAHAKPKGDASFARGSVCLSPEQREELGNKAIQVVETALRESGLETAAEVAWEFRVELLGWNNPLFKTFTATKVLSKCEEICKTMRREMKSVLFMHFSRQEAKRFELPTEGWEEVIKRWPSAAIDVSGIRQVFRLFTLRCGHFSYPTGGGIRRYPGSEGRWHRR